MGDDLEKERKYVLDKAKIDATREAKKMLEAATKEALEMRKKAHGNT